MNKSDKVYDIEWDVDFDGVINTIMEWTPQSVAEVLNNISEKEWMAMNDKEKSDFVFDSVYYNGGTNHELVANIMDLPREVELPFTVNKTNPNWVDDVADYLSDEYEFTVGGFKLKD